MGCDYNIDEVLLTINGERHDLWRAVGSLGWAFPASLGAKCAAGDRKVLCFTGDGGFYYHLAELESARRCHIPVVILVNNNAGFGQNLTGVHRIAGDRADRGEALIRFGPTNFTAVGPQLRRARHPCRAAGRDRRGTPAGARH